MNTIMDLFLSFAEIGLFTFGGGYAMIALIENMCVEKKRWITHDEMMNITVIAESTPGPIAINCATYVGYRQKGFAGALAATLGLAGCGGSSSEGSSDATAEKTETTAEQTTDETTEVAETDDPLAAYTAAGYLDASGYITARAVVDLEGAALSELAEASG